MTTYQWMGMHGGKGSRISLAINICTGHQVKGVEDDIGVE